jgi:hypothetical protein
MSRMLDIPSISAIIAGTSVVASAAFAVLQMRNWSKSRESEFLCKLQSAITDKEYRKAWAKIRDTSCANYKDCLKIEYEFELVIAFYDTLGVLLRRKLVGIGPIVDLFGTAVIRAWNRSKVYVEGARKEVQEPKLYSGFEFLYNEVHKRE